ncbi:SpoIIE family protein phosphatase [Streptomyces chartreusis]
MPARADGGPAPGPAGAAPGADRVRRGRRDARGRFFSLQAALADAVRHHPITPHAILRSLLTGVLRHTRGRQSDDIALLVLRNDRERVRFDPLGARGTARPGTQNPQPTNHL